MPLARSACRSPVCIYLDFYRNLQPQQQMSGSHSCLEVEPLQVICFLGPSFGSPHCKNNGMDKKTQNDSFLSHSKIVKGCHFNAFVAWSPSAVKT